MSENLKTTDIIEDKLCDSFEKNNYHGKVNDTTDADQNHHLPTPYIGGMATPFGIYLISGQLKAGANNFQIFSTGVFMALLFILARAILIAILTIFVKFYPGILTVISSLTNEGGGTVNNATPLITTVSESVSVFMLLLFFLLLRFMPPLSGYHAAEHKVVHLIEKGKELTIENMEEESSIHPRCGTNIASLLILIYAVVGSVSFLFYIPYLKGLHSAIVFIITLLSIIVIANWQKVGHWLQKYVTTAPPSKKQMQNGIDSANELLEKYKKMPYSKLADNAKNKFTLKKLADSGIFYILSGALLTEIIFLYLFPVLDIMTKFLVK